LVVVVVALALLASIGAQAENYKGFERPEVLITPGELNSMIEAKDPKLVLLAVASVPEYFSNHIEGAIQIWRPDYEGDPAGWNGVTDNVMKPEEFTKLAQKLGINHDSVVVVYDHKYDATRVWWAFTYYGKSNVRVLDGGIKGWTAAGFETETFGKGKAKGKGNWVASIAVPTLRATTEEIAGLKTRTDAQLWDNRANDEFCGDTTKAGAFRAGRIAWGVQADWPLLKTANNDSEFLPAADIQKVLDKLGFDKSKEQYFVCQSGVRTTNWIIALYAMGWPIEKLHNYDDSWIGWSKDDKLPLEKGCPDTTKAPWQQ
jgi:thiosulfate/3-mercaptopyruvate sulfurtransferase